ncbi:MAG: hypothetical protein EHM61_13275, partial [Acidobacteria bacterium]
MKAIFAIVVLFASSLVYGQETKAVSPDGKLEISLTITSEGVAQYRVAFNAQEVIKPSRLGLELQNQPPLGTAMKVVAARRGDVDETYRMPHGKAN